MMGLTTLSWALLVTDAANTIGHNLTPVVLIVWMVGSFISTVIASMENHGDFALTFFYPKTCIVLGAVGLACATVPSTNVVLAVAAIELGDDTLKTPEFKRLLDIYLPEVVE